MACKLEIRPMAAMEVLEAYDWHELQGEGPASEFLDDRDDIYDQTRSGQKAIRLVKFFVNEVSYSERKLRTGFATAAFTACPLTTVIVISSAPSADTQKDKKV